MGCHLGRVPDAGAQANTPAPSPPARTEGAEAGSLGGGARGSGPEGCVRGRRGGADGRQPPRGRGGVSAVRRGKATPWVRSPSSRFVRPQATRRMSLCASVSQPVTRALDMTPVPSGWHKVRMRKHVCDCFGTREPSSTCFGVRVSFVGLVRSRRDSLGVTQTWVTEDAERGPAPAATLLVFKAVPPSLLAEAHAAPFGAGGRGGSETPPISAPQCCGDAMGTVVSACSR